MSHAIPLRELGKFVYVGRPEAINDVLKMEIEGEVNQKLSSLKEGMMVYQRPTRPIPSARIPMAPKPYTVILSAIINLKGRKAWKQKDFIVADSMTPKGRGLFSSVRKYLIGKRTQYYTFKQNWVKMWAKPTGEKWSWKAVGKTEAQLEKMKLDRQDRMKKRREMRNKLAKSRLGKFFGFKTTLTRGRKPKLRLIDKLLPIKRKRTRVGKKRPRKTKIFRDKRSITVKPGRLRRAAGRGLIWEGSVFYGGLKVYWGVPSIGGGRFFNYAGLVERNPRAGRQEGSGESPYVARTIQRLLAEFRTISVGVSELYKGDIDVIPYSIEYNRDVEGYELRFQRNRGNYVIMFLPNHAYA